MAPANFTTSNDPAYVSENHLADAWVLIASAQRLIETTDSEAFCLLGKAIDEIIAAQNYLEAIDPVESPISKDVAAMLSRISARQ